MASPCHRAIGSGAIGWALGVASVALAVVFGAGSFVSAAVVFVMGPSWTASLDVHAPWYDHVLTNASTRQPTGLVGAALRPAPRQSHCCLLYTSPSPRD